jgi:hypothetical protein
MQVLVGAIEDFEDGTPKTTCFVDVKAVQGFGFLKALKGKFDQPAGALAWTVDAGGVPIAASKLSHRF